MHSIRKIKRLPVIKSTPAGAGKSPPVILTVNGGSSSIKFAVYPAKKKNSDDRPLLYGNMDGIGTDRVELQTFDARSQLLDTKQLSGRNHQKAAAILTDFLRATPYGERIATVGHRVVHGGIRLNRHTVITAKVMAELEISVPLDLAHLPREIVLIQAMTKAFPAAIQVACLDTAFHRNLPRVARLLPIPRSLGRAGIRRFGFHGLSYSFLMEELQRISPARARGRVILAHLGSGASLASVNAGRPVDTTMGFTPTAGLIMATRPGDMDPGLLVHLMRQIPLTPAAADKFINEDCGLRGISGRTGDMRQLHQLASHSPSCRDAIQAFCQRARAAIAGLAAGMGGLDVLVFSGGIGEHDAAVRRDICAGLEFIGVRLNAEANRQHRQAIAAANAGVLTFMIPTDEQKMIARIVRKLAVAALSNRRRK